MKGKAGEEHLLYHTFEPVWDSRSELLVLGSFPSAASRESKFYYGFSRNRFWKVTASIFDVPIPSERENKIKFLLDNHIALWDVVQSCRIHGSSDSSIRDVTVNDIRPLLDGAEIGKRIFTNGAAAWNLYNRYIYPQTGIRAVKLPSTSPANARYSVQRLTESWRKSFLEAGVVLPDA